VRIGEKWGFINTKGEMAIAAEYDVAYMFAEEMAAVKVADEWGYINISGEMVIEPQFAFPGHFSGGIAAVWETRNDRILIDKSGKVIWRGEPSDE
jgi:hypothetical protein